jgi:nicotinamidase-related amidase
MEFALPFAIDSDGACMSRPTSPDDKTPHRLGAGPNRCWTVSAKQVDMSGVGPAPKRITLASEPQEVTIDLHRTVLMVIDMQNDFCAAGGCADSLGVDYRLDRAPIEPLQRLLPAWRDAGGQVVWVNWGNRPDLANMPPTQLHLFKPQGAGLGLGDPLPGRDARVLQKDSWGAAIVDGLTPSTSDILVDKHRISGFWDTPLDSILRNLDTRAILFAGVNSDQCVMCTLTDANFLGYGCVMLEDCCATTSPGFCTEATVWNVKKCFGFVTRSEPVLKGLASAR